MPKRKKTQLGDQQEWNVDVFNGQVGQRIRARRQELGLTREEMCEAAEISVTFLAQIEGGKKSLTTKTLYRLLLVLGVSSDYILFGKEYYPGSEADRIMARLPGQKRGYLEQIMKCYLDSISRHAPESSPEA